MARLAQLKWKRTNSLFDCCEMKSIHCSVYKCAYYLFKVDPKVEALWKTPAPVVLVTHQYRKYKTPRNGKRPENVLLSGPILPVANANYGNCPVAPFALSIVKRLLLPAVKPTHHTEDDDRCDTIAVYCSYAHRIFTSVFNKHLPSQVYSQGSLTHSTS